MRILLADDHDIVRRGLRDMIARHPGWEVCGEARDGREAVDMAAALRPDVAIVDMAMPARYAERLLAGRGAVARYYERRGG